MGEVAIRKNKNIGSVEILNGKVPPQAIDLEAAVLGACLVDNTVFANLELKLRSEHFYKDQNQKLYEAMVEMWRKGEVIDMLTVTQWLRAKGELDEVGGGYYITQLTNRVASAANVDTHARIVIQQWMFRQYIQAASEGIRQAYNANVDVFSFLELQDAAIRKIMAVEGGGTFDPMTRFDSTMKEVDQAFAQGFVGSSWGHESFDAKLGGIMPGDLIIIAGRPGQGKTALAVWLAHQMASVESPVAFMSVEMRKESIGIREQAMYTSIPYKRIRSGNISDDEHFRIQNSRKYFEKSPVYIDDTGSLSGSRLRSKLMAFKSDHPGAKIAFIDYFQIMQAAPSQKGRTRENEVAEMIVGLKSIAKELEMALIPLSQLSRENEKRGGAKKPQLSDLKESGAIEAAADVVLFPYRAEYYDKDGIGPDGVPNTNRTEIIVGKNRQGDTGPFFMYSDIGINQYDFDKYDPFRRLENHRNHDQPF